VLQGRGLLTPLQRTILSLFAGLPDQSEFYLTGGTALAEYYLGHRLSFDLDLFTGQTQLVTPMAYELERRCAERGLEITVTRRFTTYVEYLINREGATVKVDPALDSPFRFESPVQSEFGVFINDSVDLQVYKLLAYYGRAEPRDAVDLYFVMQQITWHELAERAAKKDPGFDLYWMAVALDQIQRFPDELERWPVQMLAPCDPMQIKASFQTLAVELLSQVNRK
jgi:hypothetical protein